MSYVVLFITDQYTVRLCDSCACLHIISYTAVLDFQTGTQLCFHYTHIIIHQVDHFWAQSRSDWPQMGQILDFFRSDFITFWHGAPKCTEI